MMCEHVSIWKEMEGGVWCEVGATLHKIVVFCKTLE